MIGKLMTSGRVATSTGIWSEHQRSPDPRSQQVPGTVPGPMLAWDTRKPICFKLMQPIQDILFALRSFQFFQPYQIVFAQELQTTSVKAKCKKQTNCQVVASLVSEQYWAGMHTITRSWVGAIRRNFHRLCIVITPIQFECLGCFGSLHDKNWWSKAELSFCPIKCGMQSEIFYTSGYLTGHIM